MRHLVSVDNYAPTLHYCDLDHHFPCVYMHVRMYMRPCLEIDGKTGLTIKALTCFLHLGDWSAHVRMWEGEGVYRLAEWNVDLITGSFDARLLSMATVGNDALLYWHYCKLFV